MHLLTSPIALLPLLLPLSTLTTASNQTCYRLNGEPDSTQTPCPPSHNNPSGATMCCDARPGSTQSCISNGLCYQQDDQTRHSIWRGTCTDPTWLDPGCVALMAWVYSPVQVTDCGDGSFCFVEDWQHQNTTCCAAGQGTRVEQTYLASPIAANPAAKTFSRTVPSSTLVVVQSYDGDSTTHSPSSTSAANSTATSPTPTGPSAPNGPATPSGALIASVPASSSSTPATANQSTAAPLPGVPVGTIVSIALGAVMLLAVVASAILLYRRHRNREAETCWQLPPRSDSQRKELLFSHPPSSATTLYRAIASESPTNSLRKAPLELPLPPATPPKDRIIPQPSYGEAARSHGAEIAEIDAIASERQRISEVQACRKESKARRPKIDLMLQVPRAELPSPEKAGAGRPATWVQDKSWGRAGTPSHPAYQEGWSAVSELSSDGVARR